MLIEYKYYDLMSTPLELNDVEVTFFGLDFGLARMIGAHGFNNPTAIRDRLFYAWNLILHKEKNKFDLQKAMEIRHYKTQFDWNANRNLNVPVDGLVVNNSYTITEDEVVKYVGSYKDLPGNGIGIIFIIESFNKLEESAYIWVTIFEIESKRVISASRKAGRPGGLGIKNYWANAIHKVIIGLDRMR